MYKKRTNRGETIYLLSEIIRDGTGQRAIHPKHGCERSTEEAGIQKNPDDRFNARTKSLPDTGCALPSGSAA